MRERENERFISSKLVNHEVVFTSKIAQKEA